MVTVTLTPTHTWFVYLTHLSEIMPDLAISKHQTFGNSCGSTFTFWMPSCLTNSIGALEYEQLLLLSNMEIVCELSIDVGMDDL